MDLEIQQLIVGDLLQGKVDIGEDGSQTGHRRFATECFQVGADESVGDLGQAVEVYIFCQGHPSAVDLNDIQPAVRVRNADFDFPIEAAGPTQGRIQRVGDIGRPNHQNLAAAAQPVHQGKQLGHHPTFHLFLRTHLLTLGGNGVQFVEEDDRRSVG